MKVDDDDGDDSFFVVFLPTLYIYLFHSKNRFQRLLPCSILMVDLL